MVDGLNLEKYKNFKYEFEDEEIEENVSVPSPNQTSLPTEPIYNNEEEINRKVFELYDLSHNEKTYINENFS